MKHSNYEIKALSRETILELYQKIAPLHFPKEELRSMENLISLLDRGGYQGLGIYSAKALLGYALFLQVPGENVTLLDFYAILEEYRDLGLGSIFLQGIQDYYRTRGLQGLYIETEDISCASNEQERNIRLRRNTFYERNGAAPAGFGTTVFDVPFSIYYLPLNSQRAELPQSPGSFCASVDTVDPHTLQKGLERIYRFMLPPALYEQKVIFRMK